MKIAKNGRAWAVLLLLSLLLSSSSISRADEKPGDYFPEGILTPFEVNGWYGKDLAGMKEPSLYHLAQKDHSVEVYRCTYFPPFSEVSALRLERKVDGSGILILNKMAQVEGENGFAPGPILRHAKFLITKRGMDRFLKQIERWNFWTLPTQLKNDPCEDADVWLYEGVRNGKYHVVQRDDGGEKNLPARLPGEWLMKVAGERTAN